MTYEQYFFIGFIDPEVLVVPHYSFITGMFKC